MNSSDHIDDTGDTADRPSRPTLIEGHTTPAAGLISPARELERQREAVREACATEAAAIVSTARSEIRRIVVETQQELAMLQEQVRAVGCEPAGSSGWTELLEEASSSMLPSPAPPEGNRLAHDEAADDEEVYSRAPVSSFWTTSADTSIEAPAVRRKWWRHPAVIGAAAVVVSAIVILLLVSRGGNGASAPATDASQAASTGTDAIPSPAGVSTPATAASRTGSAADADVDGVSLTLKVERDTWLRATIDGRMEDGRVHPSGEERRITARRDVILRVGDAGAVTVSLNGGAAVPLGRDGQVVTRRFENAANESGAQRTESDEPASAALAPLPTLPPLPATGALPERGSVQNERAASTAASAPSVSPAAPATSAPEQAAVPGTAPLAPPASGNDAEREIFRSDRQWFDAYYTGDRNAMEALSVVTFTLDDRRDPRQKPPSGLRAQRTLQDVRIDFAGNGAVLFGRMVERASVQGKPIEFVSLISEVWVSGADGWRLMGLRLAPVPAAARR